MKQNVDKAFEPHVREMAVRLRQVLVELATATEVDLSQPRGAARQLDIDKTLVWKVSKIATGPDPISAMSLLPGPASQRTLLNAFSKAGAPVALVDDARSVLEELQRMIEQHADDRETFDMMVAAISRDGRRTAEEVQRKLAFQGNSAIWGMHCRVRTWSYIVCPSADPNFGSVGVLGSFVDVRRLRRDMRMTMATIAALKDDGRPMSGNPIQPLDPVQTEFDGTPTLAEYCRGNVPPIARVLGPGGITNYRLMGGEVGNLGAFTWSIGWRHPGVIARWRSEQDSCGEFGVNMLIPAEAAQLDLFVHRSFWPELNPECSVFSLLPGEPPVAHPGTDRQAVPVHQTVERLHEDPLDLAVHDVPNYANMIEWAMGSMGHSASEFSGYRVRMKFPILSTAIYMRFGLPRREVS